MTDVMLIVPPGGYYADRWKSGRSMPALGIGYVAASLKKAGISVGIIDAYVQRLSNKDIVRLLREKKTRIAGFTITTENRFFGFESIRHIKKMLPDVITIAGGPHPSLAAQDTLEHIEELDFIVRGEGELTSTELIKGLLGGGSLENIQGISYREGGQVLHNLDRPLVKELDSLPHPAREIMPMDQYNFYYDVPGKGSLAGGNIMTSRGCPFGCNFCSSSLFWGKAVRMRSIDNVIEEIKELVDRYEIELLWPFDDTFNINKKRVYRFCEALDKEKLRLNWFCEIRVDQVDRELLATMKEAGCFSVGFGVESGSQRILDEVIGKRIDLEQVRQLGAWCDELGIISNPFFIFSHPEETEQDLEQTMRLIRQWPASGKISLSLLHIYPGTALEILAKQKGILPADFTWTNPKDDRVLMLPSTQGYAPIFIDKLPWKRIQDALFEWADMQGFPVWKKAVGALKSIRSPKDIALYLGMLRTYLKRRIKR